MNWRKFKENVGMRIRLRPLPKMCTNKSSKNWKDIDWIIEYIDEQKKQIGLRTLTYGYAVTLGKDHIYSFISDPQRPYDGLKYGILKLHVTLIIEGVNIKLEPTKV
ncbi:MAG: hypothetical protein L3K25_11295 [Gammaproteobacteria bacterium]|nr:hypothetical protein [Gammaproteobacteria bacterium]